ncbi:hypothetical protein [Nostoc sp.]
MFTPVITAWFAAIAVDGLSKVLNFAVLSSVGVGMEGTERYGVSGDTLLVELFRVNGGKAGYYIANLKDKLYYYCGSTLDDVRRQFLSLGIGRTEN